MPASIQQIPSQEIFCELRLQKNQEVRRENMGNMISVHREECNYEGTEAELMGCQKPLRFCLSYFCISGKRIHCLVLAVERFCICCWCRGCFRLCLKKYSRKLWRTSCRKPFPNTLWSADISNGMKYVINVGYFICLNFYMHCLFENEF